MSEIRAITIDLDETMLDRKATFRLFIRSQIARFDQFFHDVDHDEFLSRVVELDRDGVKPRDEVFSGAARDFDLANEAGGNDNVTVQVAWLPNSFAAARETPEPSLARWPRRKRYRTLLGVFAALLAASAVVWLVLSWSR